MKVIFLDRDGVINEDVGYVGDKCRFKLIKSAVKALQILKSLGYQFIVVTNQSGIARGLFTEQEYAEVTEYMQGLLRSHGIDFLAVYHCPHHPTISGPCDCRKPLPGMFLRAADEFQLKLNESIMIGDRISDIQAASIAGIQRCFLINKNMQENNTNNLSFKYCDDLLEVVQELQ
ncbi:D-glycero-beta-D-manno-heptose 1,7-bisphosphate 7-phosphatase [Rhodobacterales bacterium FZCC0188]|nr:D-glycero-beta-D-manno-heptose 1,7-bisphosphate 7-phosphatase [Rhodobacterales bacterium FZCC0188]